MFLGPLGNHWNDLGYPQLSTLFNRPLHAIKFKDRQDQCNVGGWCNVELFAERKLHAVTGHADDLSLADVIARRDIEFLSDLCTKHADEMIRVRADEGGTISRAFVGNPAAAGHHKDSDTTLRCTGI